MSEALPTKPRITGLRAARVAIVASEYNSEFTNSLVKHAQDELKSLLPLVKIETIRVPGAFEIPVTIEQVLKSEEYNAVIALGIILKGSTAHADHIGQAVTNALIQQSITHQLPIIHEVLLMENEEQAYARCIGEKLNRGVEAARVTASMIETFSNMKRSKSRSQRMLPSKK